MKTQVVMALLMGWVVLLAGCTLPQKPLQRSGAVVNGVKGKDLQTMSDLTERQRLANTHYELANNYLQVGQLNTALDEVKRALLIDPNLLQAYHLKAIIYSQLGQTDFALRDYEFALKGLPNDPDLLNNYGWLLCNQGQFQRAINLFDRAIAVVRSTNVKPYTNAGLCHLFTRNVPKAIEYFTKALEVEPLNMIANVHMARIELSQGRDLEAQKYLTLLNNSPNATSESLWLEAKIAKKFNQTKRLNDLISELGRSFPSSKENSAYIRGMWNE